MAYPLESLRQARALTREAAELQLAAARARLAERDAEVSAAQAALDGASGAAAPLTTPSSGAELARAGAASALQRDLLRKALAAALRAQREQARALRLAELEWHAARVEHAVIDKHEQRYAAHARKRTQRALDDEADEANARNATR